MKGEWNLGALRSILGWHPKSRESGRRASESRRKRKHTKKRAIHTFLPNNKFDTTARVRTRRSQKGRTKSGWTGKC